MKIFFIAIVLFIINTIYTFDILSLNKRAHADLRNSTIGDRTMDTNEKCDYRLTTPFANRTWVFCTEKGFYGILGRANVFGKYNERTGEQCLTTEDCIYYGGHKDVCVNVENNIRVCYRNPFFQLPNLGVSSSAEWWFWNLSQFFGALTCGATIFATFAGLIRCGKKKEKPKTEQTGEATMNNEKKKKTI